MNPTMSSPRSPVSRPLATLRRFARPPAPEEQCELCGQPLADQHPHLVEPATRRLLCACQACALLFDNEADTKFDRVPRDAYALTDFQLDEANWSGLNIPIGLAFFFHNSASDQIVGVYPSPAGPTETELDPEAWVGVVEANPELRSMQSNTQALLVNRVRLANDFFLAPIDKCYELVGLIRSNWEGFTGGDDAWDEIERFFTDMRAHARQTKPRPHTPAPRLSPTINK